MRRIIAAFGFLLLCQMFIFASEPQLMDVKEVRIGMKGYGMTVFQGTKPERFEVEVLGVVAGMANPKQDIVIARLSGALAERTGVFAGMSGSPVFIDGKLLGAVAFAFPFSKEPIAGIQPIQNMISVVEQGAQPEVPRVNEPLSFNKLMASATVTGKTGEAQNSYGTRTASGVNTANYGGQAMVPIATPV